MDENRAIKDVVMEHINRIPSKTVGKYTPIKIVYPDYSYLYMTADYILRNEFLNKKFHVYNHFTNSDDILTIYIEEDDVL